MYAVIKTGGKQYRVSPGDLLVVEKLAGEPGAEVAFDQVLLVGEGEAVTVGAPIVDGASVSATLIETRKGEKLKVFKKIRRQGYRRTGGHRQTETVLRVTSVVGGGATETWDGEVDLTPRLVLNARARNLAPRAAGESASTAKAAARAEAASDAAADAPTEVVAKAAKKANASTGKAEAKAATPKMTRAQGKSPAHKSAPKGKN
jgi:large subunit ribosomal protein L21